MPATYGIAENQVKRSIVGTRANLLQGGAFPVVSGQWRDHNTPSVVMPAYATETALGTAEMAKGT